MDQNKNTQMLELIVSPAFFVKNNIISAVNQAAEKLQIETGTPIRSLLATGQAEYAAFSGGCLCLTVCILNQSWDASVVRVGTAETFDVFTLDQPLASPELQALALAARELRAPLSEALISARHLSDLPEARENAQRLNRKLYQLLRLISNMSDAYRPLNRKESLEIVSFYSEIMEKAAAMAEAASYAFQYESIPAPLYLVGDPQQLERAALNLVSNAMKFTPKGGCISASLTRSGKQLQLRIADSGDGIPEEILGTVFRRHLRQPAIEEGRQGIGLGLLLVRSAAANHGGTVLIDRKEGSGTRVTMTIAIDHGNGDTLSTSRLRIDYGGEMDHALIELADVLPPELYESV